MAADTVLGVLKKFPTPAQKNLQNQLKPTYRTFIKGVVHLKKKKLLIIYHVIQDVHVILSSVEKKLRFLMKTFLDFSPYNALHWEPNGSRSKRYFQCKLQTVQRALTGGQIITSTMQYTFIYLMLIKLISLFGGRERCL